MSSPEKVRSFPLTSSRKFPKIPKNVVVNKPNKNVVVDKPKHHSMNPIKNVPEPATSRADVFLGCNAISLPMDVRRLIAMLNNKGIICNGVTKKSTGVYVIHNNSSDEYIVNASGVVKRKINKFRKTRRLRKTKSRFRK